MRSSQFESTFRLAEFSFNTTKIESTGALSGFPLHRRQVYTVPKTGVDLQIFPSKVAAPVKCIERVETC